ncbi:MAG: hypothetical protein JSV88_08110 [Candidatus Aminicenantes bacterium]|nr:MAG: hypothetical protein JSV88_08110 [Candidatus Aminicenantes bacterium]
MTLKLCKKKEENNVDETLGNIAVVLIELSKFEKETDTKNEYLKQVCSKLDDIIAEDFNTHWDRARALYYTNSEENKNKIMDSLEKAVREIDNKKDGDNFLKWIKSEQKEILLDGKHGFPGNEELIETLKIDLGKLHLS